ncbi:MAG: VPLPA-CTERM-specific exosortase XrtD [Hyphomicrobium sp.]|uniref:VPLPA-CTERM-specific exosortase XrtD n=1 Tax=Hyphomicrobium sp. TaxID=82 RepID=UPI0039E32DAB
MLAAVIAFSGPQLELVRRWASEAEYGHGFLIYGLAGWLLWTRRAELGANIGKPSWIGPIAILVAATMHVVGLFSAIYILSHIAFVLALAGIALSFGGYRFYKVAAPSIFFLLLAIPLPYFLQAELTWRLQLVSSQLGTFLIGLFGIPAYLEGNIIDLGTYQLQVVEACSGLRYLYPLLSLSFLAAYFLAAPMWQRLVIFLSAIPITIVMNGIRIALVGVLVNSWGPQDADGLLHFLEGFVVFLLCVAALVAEIFILAKLTGWSVVDALRWGPSGALSSWRAPGGERLQAVTIFSALVLTALAAASYSVAGRAEVIPPHLQLATFPMSFSGWQGRAQIMPPATEAGLKLDDYMLADYRDGRDGVPINLYVAYYASQRDGASPHSPLVCMPGGGWQITEFSRIDGPSPQLASAQINRAVIGREDDRALVYYWYVQRGRVVANEYLAKWYLLRDALIENRTDGALVRVSTPLIKGEEPAAAEARIKKFIDAAMPNLQAYLPREGSDTSVNSSRLL